MAEHCLDQRGMNLIRSKECCQAVPQIVPAESRTIILVDYSCCYGCGTQVVFSASRCGSRNSSLLTTRCEHPVVVQVVARFFPPLIQEFVQGWMHGDGLHRSFGLALRRSAFAPGSLHKYLIVVRIDVLPPQGETLFRPERGCCVNQCQGPLQLGLRSVELL